MDEYERKLESNPYLAEITEKLPNIPATFGCYLWLGEPVDNADNADNKEGAADGPTARILYIGKSVNLRSRVRQYLHSDDYKTRFLMQRVRNIEWMVTSSEMEALLLENTLIKKHTPPYNVQLKDDKRYPYLCLTMSEPFPRLILTRRKTSTKHLYFGPYSDVRAARSTMALIHKVFPIRKRPLKLPLKTPARPCLNYHLGRCWAPCTGKVDVADYRLMVGQIQDFLEGNDERVQQQLKKKMQEYSSKLEFEKAARLRDILHDIELLNESQEVESANTEEDFDIVGVYAVDRVNLAASLNTSDNFIEYFTSDTTPILGQLALLRVRGGKLMAKRSYAFSESGGWNSEHENHFEEEFIVSFFREHYLQFRDIPPAIYLSHSFGDVHTWQQTLSQVAAHPVQIISSLQEQSEKHHLVKMATTNASLSLRERVLNEKTRNQRIGLRQIQKFLHLKELPRVIECYDISNIQGSEPVASGVMLRDGLPHKSGYRKYAIKTVQGANDPAMIHEVIDRRMKRITAGQIKAPDLIVIDGGITQLNAAKKARDAYGLRVPLMGLAKKYEEIYTEDGKVLRFGVNSPGMLILRLARDEAHRFGVAYHRNLRLKRNLASLLDGVAGIGQQRRKTVMNLLRRTDIANTEQSTLTRLLKTECELSSAVAQNVVKRIFAEETTHEP